jgi:hypothetical protein
MRIFTLEKPGVSAYSPGWPSADVNHSVTYSHASNCSHAGWPLVRVAPLMELFAVGRETGWVVIVTI